MQSAGPSSKPGYWLVSFLLAALLAGACLLRAYIGMEGIHIYTHDGFVFLDGAWRVLHGQRSNIDFFSDHGPFMYLETALGLKLAHGSPAGFGWMQGLMGAILGLWAFVLTSHRLAPVPRALFCSTIVFLAVAPYTPGEAITQTSVDIVYNRYGYCLIALAALEAVLERDRTSATAEAAGGFSTGFIAAWLLFLKISYFLWVCPLVLVLVPCRTQTLRRWIAMAAGFAAAFLPFFFYAGGSLMPMINDLRIVGAAKHVQWHWYVVEALYLSVAPLALFVFTAVALAAAEGARGRVILQIALAGFTALTGGYFLLLTNYQRNRMPLSAIAAILILHLVHSRPQVPAHSLLRTVATLWGAWFILISVGLDCGGLLAGVIHKISARRDARTQFHSARLAGFSTFEYGYVDFVNDGLHLVEQFRRPGDTIMSMDFSNPFSYTLAMPPARGGTTGLQFRTNFDDAHHPSPEWLLGGASLIIEPTIYSDGSLQSAMPRIYGPYLSAHYRPVGRSAQWKLYRRNE